MIMIFGTLVLNDISRCFFQVLIFWAVRGGKGLKITQNEQ